MKYSHGKQNLILIQCKATTILRVFEAVGRPILIDYSIHSIILQIHVLRFKRIPPYWIRHIQTYWAKFA